MFTTIVRPKSASNGRVRLLLLLGLLWSGPLLVSAVNRGHLNKCIQTIKGDYWTLVASSEFDDKSELLSEWTLDNEVNQCSGNGIQQISCNSNTNAKIEDGYLLLNVKKEPINNLEFTGATITSKQNFTQGRWEIRARFPEGEFLRTAFFTVNPRDKYWHQMGQIDLSVYALNDTLFRGIHFANSSSSYQPVDWYPFRNQTDFHTFGLEWTAFDLTFFFDNQYSFAVALDSESNRSLANSHLLRIQLGVGGIPIVLPNTPDRLQKFDWNCPSLIIDYIRVYQRRMYPDNCDTRPIVMDRSPDVENGLVNNICRTNMIKPIVPPSSVFSLGTSHWLIIAGIIVVVSVAGYFIFQLREIRSSLDDKQETNIQQLNMWNDLSGNVYREPNEVYDTVEYEQPDEQYTGMVNHTERSASTNTEPEYLKMTNSTVITRPLETEV